MKVILKTLWSWTLGFLIFWAIIYLPQQLSVENQDKLHSLITIFISIVVQALPFVLIGVFGSALLQNFITVDMIEDKLTRMKRLPGILMAIGVGFFFPVCDCGVIPVVRRMLMKKVPPYMAIAFLVTAPLVNPITVWATATAFGYNIPVTLIRVGIAILVGLFVALLVSEVYPNIEDIFNQRALKEMELAVSSSEVHEHPCCEGHTVDTEHESKFSGVFRHANEEFLEVGRFLVIGALIASTIQTFIPKESLMLITQNPMLSVLVMMLLALCLSLCAEADAFVARSFTFHFPLGSVMAFMVFGQMLDIKNTALLLKSFKPKTILFIFGFCAAFVFFYCLVINLFSTDQLLWGGSIR